jgi:NADH-ubiquinone oxidoreductase chain 4
MLLLSLIIVPILGIFIVSALSSFIIEKDAILKKSALAITLLNLILSLVMFLLYDNSNKNFQFVQEHFEVNYCEFFLGVDGLSVYFIVLTTLIIPISILSN